MSTETLEVATERLLQLTRAIARGNRGAADDLMMFAVEHQVPETVADLAEAIGSLMVQKEAREFHLELMVEDLLAAQAALDKAKRDPLTGLPNRAMFHELLDKTCQRARETGAWLTLMFIDLDRFKQVNDTLGHAAGDELLIQVSQRLTECVGQHSIVARLAGDEFTAILPDIQQQEDAVRIANDMVKALQRPFSLSNGEAKIGGSVGLSFFPLEADTPITLLKNADVAMYQAKAAGRVTVRLYSKA